MSKPRAKWWGYIRRILCDYPRMRRELDDLQATLQSHDSTEVRGHSGTARPVERLATATLPDPQEQRELEAVEAAWAGSSPATQVLIRGVFFNRRLTLNGAAMKLHISYRTARRRQEAFIMRVANSLGLV